MLVENEHPESGAQFPDLRGSLRSLRLPEGITDGLIEGITRVVNVIVSGSLRPTQLDLPTTPPKTTVQLESREHRPGVGVIHSSGDAIYVFSGLSALANYSYLLDAAALFAHRNVGWSAEYARYLVGQGMKLDGLVSRRRIMEEELDEDTVNRMWADLSLRKQRAVPSVSLFRKEDAPEGHYGGISVQRMFFPKIEQVGAEVPVLYHILRAFEPGFRNRNRGRLAVELALHKSGARYYMHKTPNPFAYYTNTKSESLVQSGRRPKDGPYEEGTVDYDVAQAVLDFLMPGVKLPLTGVIKNNYPEPNTSFDPDELYGEVLGAWKQMQELGVDRYSPVLAEYKVK